MYKKICKVLLSFFILTLIFGCATGLKELKGTEKLEAKDWLHAGDLAYKVGDYDNAQYFYELVTKKYPDTHYSKKAQYRLEKVEFKRSLIGQTVEDTIDFVEPIL